MNGGIYVAKGVKGFQKRHKHSEEVKKKIGDANRNQVYFNCDYCGQISSDKPSSYKKKKRHFCGMKCYSDFRKNKVPLEEQHAYKGIRKPGENKQVYHRRYVKKNPENISHLKARRYARERNAEGNHTLQEWNSLKEKFNYKEKGGYYELAFEEGKLPISSLYFMVKDGKIPYLSDFQCLFS